MFSLGLECPGLISARASVRGVLEMFDLLSAAPGIGVVEIWRDRVRGVVLGGWWAELSPVGQECGGESGTLMFGRVIGKGELVDPSVPVAVILGGVLCDHCFKTRFTRSTGLHCGEYGGVFLCSLPASLRRFPNSRLSELSSVVGDNDAGAAVS